jgi:hypothetical protein
MNEALDIRVSPSDSAVIKPAGTLGAATMPFRL